MFQRRFLNQESELEHCKRDQDLPCIHVSFGRSYKEVENFTNYDKLYSKAKKGLLTFEIFIPVSSYFLFAFLRQCKVQISIHDMDKSVVLKAHCVNYKFSCRRNYR